MHPGPCGDRLLHVGYPMSSLAQISGVDLPTTAPALSRRWIGDVEGALGAQREAETAMSVDWSVTIVGKLVGVGTHLSPLTVL